MQTPEADTPPYVRTTVDELLHAFAPAERPITPWQKYITEMMQRMVDGGAPADQQRLVVLMPRRHAPFWRSTVDTSTGTIDMATIERFMERLATEPPRVHGTEDDPHIVGRSGWCMCGWRRADA